MPYPRSEAVSIGFRRLLPRVCCTGTSLATSQVAGDESSASRALGLLDLSHRFNPASLLDDGPDRLAPRQSLHQALDARPRLVLGGESQLGLTPGGQTGGSLTEHRLVTIL